MCIRDRVSGPSYSKQLELRLPSPDLSESHNTPNSSLTRNSLANTGQSQGGVQEFPITEVAGHEESPELMRLNSDEVISEA